LVDQSLVLALYDEGVSAVARARSGAWDERVCGEWSAHDLAGHLVCVVGWYHDWLDAAERGSSLPPFPASDLVARNAQAMRGLHDATGPERVEQFVAEAQRYAARLPDDWDLAYGYPYGTVTAGLHAGVAAGEWHLHAWDLSGGTHQPSNPEALFVAVATAMTAAKGGVAGAFQGVMVPLASRRKPWQQLLRRSGRR
jgi:hypothetical protein